MQLLTFMDQEYALVIELEVHVNRLTKYKTFIC